MKIGFAQINPTVGDLRGNYELIIGAYERLAAAGAELVLTSEIPHCWSGLSIVMRDAVNRFITLLLCSSAASRSVKRISRSCRLMMFSMRTVISRRADALCH